MRDDPRNAVHVVGKSINLALSERGRSALRSLGLEDMILDKYSIKMHARMIHDLNGNKRKIPYGKEDQCILSVSRRFLNELLISEAEKYPNVTLHFNSKFTHSNLSKGELTFQKAVHSIVQDDNNNEEFKWEDIDQHADVVLGCDGAYSAVRRQMVKLLLLDYSQKYIEHGYLELCIPPTESGDFAMEPNYLHIWPRGSFMMIALPNLDRSFTVTLFMPFKKYDDISDTNKLLQFFEANFPDAVSLITKYGFSL